MRKLEDIAIIDEGPHWAIHGTEDELDEIMRLAKSAASLAERVFQQSEEIAALKKELDRVKGS